MAEPAPLPPPLHDIPTAKERKYDRQLRLWGASGQMALEDTHILLVNSGPGVTGVETLKNLVLPGVGNFTILDSAIVREEDLGVNFFLEESSLGKWRAEECVKGLAELNPGVSGHAVIEPLETFATKPNAFSPYNLILCAAPLPPKILSLIQSHASATLTPLFYFHSLGFYSAFALALPSTFPIVDTHPDPTATTDLRLLKPWPALSAFAAQKTNNLDALAEHDKGHVPYLCLLLHYLEVWKSSHDGAAPKNYKEKTEFRSLVRSGDANEENYDEACAAVLKSLNPPVPSQDVLDILSAPETQHITATSPAFWLIANAINAFYVKNGQLPLPGSVPDMKARSQDYVELQTIYKSKAREDSAEVLATVRALEQSTQRSPKLRVEDKEVGNFCKGAAHIHLVRGRPFLQVVDSDEGNGGIDWSDRDAKGVLRDLQEEDSAAGIYIAFLAWDLFVATHRTEASDTGGEGMRVPGSSDKDAEEDTHKLTSIAHHTLDQLIKAAGAFIEDPEYSAIKTSIGNFCRELVRAGGGELHNTASLTGGLLAQEAVKVVTGQYVPVGGVCVWDGVKSRTWVGKV